MDMPVEESRNREPFSNVASALTWQARRQPNRTAIHYPARTALGKKQYRSFSYEELNTLSDCYARGLQDCSRRAQCPC